MELYKLTISEVRALLDKKEVSVKDVVESIFKRIHAVEDTVKAFVTLTRDKAFEMAEGIQDKMDLTETKNRTSILGIPLAIKDNMCTKGILTSCSSNILQNFVPPYESTVTARLLEQGYVLVGKTNLDEFAMGSSTENSGFFTTKKPVLFGTPISKGLWEFRGSISKDCYQRFPTRSPDGINGFKRTLIPRY